MLSVLPEGKRTDRSKAFFVSLLLLPLVSTLTPSPEQHLFRIFLGDQEGHGGWSLSPEQTKKRGSRKASERQRAPRVLLYFLLQIRVWSNRDESSEVGSVCVAAHVVHLGLWLKETDVMLAGRSYLT